LKNHQFLVVGHFLHSCIEKNLKSKPITGQRARRKILLFTFVSVCHIKQQYFMLKNLRVIETIKP